MYILGSLHYTVTSWNFKIWVSVADQKNVNLLNCYISFNEVLQFIQPCVQIWDMSDVCVSDVCVCVCVCVCVLCVCVCVCVCVWCVCVCVCIYICI